MRMPTPEAVFQFGNAVALLGWILLLAAPHWRWTRRATYGTGAIALVLAVVYTVLLAASIGSSGHAPDFNSIAGIRALMSDDRALVAGWLHYLAFDLFVGAWQVHDSKQRGLRHVWVIPSLVCTFLAGPFGLLLYFLIRNLVGKDKVNSGNKS